MNRQLLLITIPLGTVLALALAAALYVVYALVQRMRKTS